MRMSDDIISRQIRTVGGVRPQHVSSAMLWSSSRQQETPLLAGYLQASCRKMNKRTQFAVSPRQHESYTEFRISPRPYIGVMWAQNHNRWHGRQNLDTQK
jgi:hypothetical protein